MTEEDDMLEEIAASLIKPFVKPSVIGNAKRGRRPKLTRSQVDDILLSDALVEALAIRYGVSISTIVRAKNHQYVTADEPGHHTYFHSGKGRRTKNNTSIDEETRAKIAADPSPPADVAKAYGVSRSYVYNLRSRYGTIGVTPRRGPLPPEVMVEIRKSTLTNEQLAHLFDLSVFVVKAVRSGYEKQTDT